MEFTLTVVLCISLGGKRSGQSKDLQKRSIYFMDSLFAMGIWYVYQIDGGPG